MSEKLPRRSFVSRLGLTLTSLFALPALASPNEENNETQRS